MIYTLNARGCAWIKADISRKKGRNSQPASEWGEIICFSRKKVVLFTSSPYISNGNIKQDEVGFSHSFFRPMPLQIFTYSSRQPSVNFLVSLLFFLWFSSRDDELDVHFRTEKENFIPTWFRFKRFSSSLIVMTQLRVEMRKENFGGLFSLCGSERVEKF
jgi:hypothetical protein